MWKTSTTFSLWAAPLLVEPPPSTFPLKSHQHLPLSLQCNATYVLSIEMVLNHAYLTCTNGNTVALDKPMSSCLRSQHSVTMSSGITSSLTTSLKCTVADSAEFLGQILSLLQPIWLGSYFIPDARESNSKYYNTGTTVPAYITHRSLELIPHYGTPPYHLIPQYCTVFVPPNDYSIYQGTAPCSFVLTALQLGLVFSTHPCCPPK